MKTIVALLVAALVSSYHDYLNPQYDVGYFSVGRSVLELLEQQGAKISVFVVPKSADARVRPSLSGLRNVIAPADLSRTSEFELPAGYFKVDVFSVSGSFALVGGTMGPIRRSSGPRDFQGCGVNFSIPLQLREGGWHVETYTVTQC